MTDSGYLGKLRKRGRYDVLLACRFQHNAGDLAEACANFRTLRPLPARGDQDFFM
jgi:hypothetical protein